jgi:hypothetical protein
MRAEHDGAAGLERDQDLVDRGRGRIRRGHDGRHDTEGLGNLDDLAIVEAIHHAHRAHRTNEVEDALRGEEILLDLVRLDAVAGLLDRHPSQSRGVRRNGRRHRGDDRVDLFLRQLGEQRLRLPGRPSQRARF